MPVQRTRTAENRVRNRLSNGPLREQSNVWLGGDSVFPPVCKVFCNVWAYVSCREYGSIPTSARIFEFVNQGGTADMFYSSLTEI